MQSNSSQFKELELGDVAFESKERAESQAVDDLRVYGVDRTDGLTADAKYTSKNLGRYKVLRPAMFAYNPMRLNIGSIAYCTEKHRVGLVSPDYVVFGCKKGKLDPDFFSYFIKGPVWKQWTTAAGVGSVRVRVYFRELARMPIPLPPIAEQRAIAEVLGALDDKIELNRRMNVTLEAMARALFQSWFVDLDPVRAKLDGRQPMGLDAATAALFPDSFQDSEIGPIPSGWTAKPLTEAFDVNPRRSLRQGQVAPYLDMKNLPSQGHCAGEVVAREFSSGTKFQNGDTLLARITPCLENGKTGYVDFLEEGQVGWGSTEYIVFAPKPPLPPQFGYLLARSDALRAHAIQNMTGTSGRQRVPADCFEKFWLAVPTPEVADRFDEISKPLMTKIKANAQQSRILAMTRDNLLPKLLSGAINPETITSHS